MLRRMPEIPKWERPAIDNDMANIAVFGKVADRRKIVPLGVNADGAVAVDPDPNKFSELQAMRRLLEDVVLLLTRIEAKMGVVEAGSLGG